MSFSRRRLCVGSYRLPRLIRMGRARELFLLGGTMNARRALESELVTEVVLRADLQGRCLAWTEGFLDAPHTSMIHIKRLSYLASQTDFAGFM